MRYQFVDCRWELGKPDRGRELYLEGHIPGAAFLDVERDLSTHPGKPPVQGGRHPLPSEGDFARAASRAGIGPGVFAVAYDQGMSGGAARLWWLLRHFGHDDVAVLEGGLGAWLGRLVTGEEEIQPNEFVPNTRRGDTIDAEEIERRAGEDALVLVDARAPERYRGETEPIDPVAGHIPGARNVPFSDTASLPEEVLRAEEIAVYCGSGITACVDILALARAGREDAKLYPGSWSEWSALGLPVERG
ncbi:MAG: sulfurtransferase [Actinobacteria bacterium]|nr:sulfurtransferase [Actinomycetota bacterium]